MPKALVDFTLSAREILVEQGRIEPDAVERSLPQTDVRVVSSFAEEATRLAIRMATAAPWNDVIGERIQEAVFLETGVIVPRIRVVRDHNLPLGHWALEIGTSNSSVLISDSPSATFDGALEALTSALASRAGDLLGAASVDHQLDFLAQTMPTLIFCVRSLVPMPVLLAALRARLPKNTNLGLMGLLEVWVLNCRKRTPSSGRAFFLFANLVPRL